MSNEKTIISDNSPLKIKLVLRVTLSDLKINVDI